jgi:hypothetical protein
VTDNINGYYSNDDDSDDDDHHDNFINEEILTEIRDPED